MGAVRNCPFNALDGYPFDGVDAVSNVGFASAFKFLAIVRMLFLDFCNFVIQLHDVVMVGSALGLA